MVVAISGASGFVGGSLVQMFQGLGWTVRVINRDSFAMADNDFTSQIISGADVVINLAGAPVSKRWTAAYKQEISASRTGPARKIVTAILAADNKPVLFISASAVGIYDSGNIHSESENSLSGSFLAGVCRSWETEAVRAAGVTRVVIMRLGVVLGPDGGALKKMYLPFSVGLGGKLGSGRQFMSFIHIADLLGIIRFIIENPAVEGIVNGVSPYPVSNEEFTRTLSRVLKQPAWLSIPAFALKLIYGEGAEIILEGQCVKPEKILDAGYRFRYPTLQNALVAIYG
jgi:uncharacterized protein (TIGR01777 family)